jgi:N-acetylglucosaminyldiphosphoundecaprenol N-acetyl-beta-D-mannosaminyltransferase
MRILDVRIDTLTWSEALQKVGEFLVSQGQKMMCTPNPEMLVKAQKDLYFRKVLNSGDLNVCDGAGIQFVAPQKIERIPGVDFMLAICRLAEQHHKSVFLLGSKKQAVVDKAIENLQKEFPRLQLAGTSGPDIQEQGGKIFIDDNEQKSLVEYVKKNEPDILFVALGMGKQEKWIYENLATLPSVKVAMGVGGSFDFISGRIKRAPLLMRKLRLEWLYRLIQEPKRLGRIFNATAVFIFLFWKNGK